MSQILERINGHQVFFDIEDFSRVLELAREACSQAPILLDNWDRANAVARHIRRSLDQIDPLLVVSSTLANLSSYLQQARAEIDSFSSNGNVGHWSNAQAHLDNSLTQVSSLPRQTLEGIDGMREAASSFRSAVGSWLDAIRKDTDGISQMQGTLQARISEATAEINSQKQRLDTAIAAFQQQFSDAQQAKQTEFAAQELARAQVAARSEQDRQEAFTTATALRAESEREAASEAAKAHAALVAKLNEDTAAIVSAMETQKGYAQKLIGIITDTGMAYGYQKTANEERDRAALWKGVAFWSLVAWIVIGVGFFYFTFDKDLTWATVVRQLLISTPFILLAGFAALQVSRHQKNERGLRQAELELASIDPFLATLTDEDRNSVKREFATRYFGHRETDHRLEKDDVKMAERFLELAKIVQEIRK
ncbi:hypothetical protein [Methyloversatilis sp.]|uniref:hypothetical protein n=1 Tax=Methyloversatilis sp. TaxID=2569862 RepID=UPI003F70C4F4